MEKRESRQKPLILITGSEGRIGTAIAAESGDKFTVLGFEQECDTEVECIGVDISSDAAVSRAFQQLRKDYGQRIASVIHLAAFYDFSEQYDAIDKIGPVPIGRQNF